MLNNGGSGLNYYPVCVATYMDILAKESVTIMDT